MQMVSNNRTELIRRFNEAVDSMSHTELRELMDSVRHLREYSVPVSEYLESLDQELISSSTERYSYKYKEVSTPCPDLYLAA